MIEGNTFDSRLQRQKETAELDVTSTYFPTLISECHGAVSMADCFHGQLLTSFVQEKL